MKIKFRTALLVFLFIKLCVLFTVLQESLESLAADDHPLIYGTRDIYLFDLMLSSVCALSMTVSLVLIVLFAVGHSKFRKPFIVVAFACNLILVAPFFYSGLYLTFNDDSGLEMSSRMNASFQKMFDFADDYNSRNLTGDGDNSTSPVTPSSLDDYLFVTRTQKRYCCCGLDGGGFYGFDNATTALQMRIPFTSKLDIRCPLNSLFKNSTCGDSHLHGCEPRIKQVHPTRILLYSCIGAVASTLFLVASPFIYSQFELDRRRARSQYIRDWRRAIELHTTEHRLAALRRAGGEKEGSPVVSEQEEPLLPENPIGGGEDVNK